MIREKDILPFKKEFKNNIELEYEKCTESPLYFYNTYIRPDDLPILTQDEWNERLKQIDVIYKKNKQWDIILNSKVKN